MADADLLSLQANATRLATAGTERQQTEAERLLPIIAAAVDERAAAHAEALVAKRAEQREARRRAKQADDA